MKNEFIQKDGRYYKKCSIVMLPTQKESEICVGLNGLFVYNNYPISYTQNRNDDFLNQHVHFLSDEEIKEGDWILVPTTDGKTEFHWSNCIPKKAEDNFAPNKFVWKIIASTDDSLEIKTGQSYLTKEAFIKLPRPSNEFLQAYCKADGKIDEVLIEVEKVCKKCGAYNPFANLVCLYPPHPCNGNLEVRIKVAPDNTITIKPI